jgi:DUF1680 family protein
MEIHRVFHEVDLKDIQPRGWLRQYLEIQRDGLTGHPEASGYPFDAAWWGVEEHQAGLGKPGYQTGFWGPYEQTAYWIDGAIRCGYLLHDEALVKKAGQPIDYVMAHPDQDGYLGPQFMKHGPEYSRWPHVVFFRAWMARYSATGDKAILKALTDHYLSGTRAHIQDREVCNIEPMLWTYEQTGNEKLLRHAIEAYEDYNRLCKGKDNTVEVMLSDKRGTEHGVTYNEIGKLAAIAYMYTGNQRYLDAAINGFRKLERDQVLIDGVNSSTEALKGKDPLDSHETCDISDHAWALGYLLMATGRAEYADKIERACFNALPGAVMSNFHGLQYFSCPNQVLATSTSNHNDHFKGFTWMAFRPNPATECCPGDVHRAIPDFASRMWMKDDHNGLDAVLYSPGSVTTRVGDKDQEVTVVEETDYPFSETITFTIKAKTAVDFPFSLRIPGWCQKARISINGKPTAHELQAGTFVAIRKIFKDGDQIRLELPMELKLSHWPKGGIGIERGPLVFALKIAEEWQESSDQDPISEDWRVVPGNKRSMPPEYPAWNLYPASPWNYALALDEKNLNQVVKVITHPAGLTPWSPENAPIELQVPARRVDGWEIERLKSLVSNFVKSYDNANIMVTEAINGNFELTPDLPDPKTLPQRLSAKTEMVTLIPYGCTHLRISIFPHCKP